MGGTNIVAATRENEAVGSLTAGVKLNYDTHLVAVLGPDADGIDANGLEILGLDPGPSWESESTSGMPSITNWG